METRGVEVTVLILGKCSEKVPHHQDVETGREGDDNPAQKNMVEEARLTFGDL